MRAAILTRPQREALLTIYNRQPELNDGRARRQWGDLSGRTYLQFRRTARYDFLLGCVMVPFAGMVLGIERDGYTHS